MWGNLMSNLRQGNTNLWDNTMGVKGLGGTMFGSQQGGLNQGWMGQAGRGLGNIGKGMWDNTLGVKGLAGGPQAIQKGFLGKTWDNSYGNKGLGGFLSGKSGTFGGLGGEGGIGGLFDRTVGKHGLGGGIGDIFNAAKSGSASKLFDETLGKGGIGGAVGSAWDNTFGKVGKGLGKFFSDVNLKENIVKVGVSPKGVNIYEFDYRDKRIGRNRYRGVLAHEVPWAMEMDKTGYLAVDYDKLDVELVDITRA